VISPIPCVDNKKLTSTAAKVSSPLQSALSLIGFNCLTHNARKHSYGEIKAKTNKFTFHTKKIWAQCTKQPLDVSFRAQLTC
jgi:hypothetical protein